MRYYGKIGYGVSGETTPGVWAVNSFVERDAIGDIIKNVRKLDHFDKVNEDVNMVTTISIVADPYAIDHYLDIKYAELDGKKWTVTSAEIQRPRIILYLGGLYNVQ